MADPWFKFYPTDWRSDPRLRMCGPAARGLWVELMCLMHEAKPYGHLLIAGQPPTDAQLAVLTGIPSEQLPALLGELESAGVFSRTGKGAVYSRRMTRDEKKRRTARKNGKSGGNPSLGKGKGKTPSDNPPVKPHIPEATAREGGSGTAREIIPILEAAKVDPTKHALDGWLDFHVFNARDRWQQLGLTDDEIVQVIQDVMTRLPDPPATTAYFNKPMQRAAGRKQAGALEPIPFPGGHNGKPTREQRAAERLHSDLEWARAEDMASGHERSC